MQAAVPSRPSLAARPQPGQAAETLLSFRRYLAAAGKTIKTINSYCLEVRHFAEWCAAEDRPLLAVTRDDVTDYLAPCYRAHTWATVGYTIVSLRSFYLWALAAGLCECNPTANIPCNLHSRESEKPTTVAAVRSLIATTEAAAEQRRVTESPEWGAHRDGFTLHVRGQGGTRDTVRTHVMNISHYARWCRTNGLTLDHGTRQHVQQYIVAQINTLTLSTARNRLMSVRAFYRYLIAIGGRTDDPTAGLKVKRAHIEPKRPYTEEELKAMLGACATAQDRAFLLVCISTGARISEVCGYETDHGIRAQDIDWTRGLILLRGKGDKQRYVAPGQVVMTALREHVNGHKGAIWLTRGGEPFCRSRGQKTLYTIAERARIAGAYAHRFRVTFANSFLSGGGDLQALQFLMGHSRIDQTAHYTGFSAAERALDQQRRMAVVDRLVAAA